MSQLLIKHLKPEIEFIPPSSIKYKTQINVCVLQAFKRRGYTKGDSQNTWNIYWAEKESIQSVYETYRVGKQQKLNHFRSFYQLCKKDNLNRNIKKYRRGLEREGKELSANQYNFCPLTYHLPLQYGLFLEQFKKNANQESFKNIWIMKPVGSSQGKGIFLLNKISSLEQWESNAQAEPYIIQKYIQNPLLLGGKKFDLRLYVLCTSYRPLEVYLYRSGFARLTHFRYDSSKIHQNQIHLTNVAIQKHTSDYNEENGGKWVLDKLKLFLMSQYTIENVNKCFYEIQLLIIKTLRSVSKVMSNEKNSFQLYGFDILIDQLLFPWLIQVNGSPSMRANTEKDREMKCGLIDDVLSILNLQKILQGNEEQVGGFDLICKNDILKTNQYFGGRKISLLGCMNNREQNYREIARKINNNNNNQSNQSNQPNQPNRNIGDKIDRSTNNPQLSPVKTFSVRKRQTKQQNLKQNINIAKQMIQSSFSQIKSSNNFKNNLQSTMNSPNKNWRIKTNNPQITKVYQSNI